MVICERLRIFCPLIIVQEDDLFRNYPKFMFNASQGYQDFDNAVGTFGDGERGRAKGAS